MNTEKAGISHYREFDGPMIFRQGFRPFFLGAGLWSLASLALWISLLWGVASIPTAFEPTAWHAHEMIFGFTMAAIAGFLLTAIPNWTGRMPLQGLSLMALFAAWLVGRFAMATSALIGVGSAAALDLAFPTVLLVVIMREIVSGKNWRNLPMPIALAALLSANVLTHLDAGGLASTGPIGQRFALATIVMLISLIGGRVIPSFTRNWLVKHAESKMPASFCGFDRVCLGLTFLGIACWVVAPDSRVTGIILLSAGLAGILRLARWRGHRTLSEPLIWSLHAGFAWVPLGLSLLGIGVFLPGIVPPTAGLHALTAGAMGSMILAMMTRATLGRTNRQLTADNVTAAIYLLITLAAMSRVAAPIVPDIYDSLLWLSGVIWIAAFGLFSVQYGRYLLDR